MPTNIDTSAAVLLRTAAAALATKRLTTLVVEDEITRDIRDLVWRKYPPETTKLGYLVTCVKCSSVWAGAVVLLLERSRYTRWIVSTLALSESALALNVAVNSANARLRADSNDSGGFFS